MAEFNWEGFWSDPRANDEVLQAWAKQQGIELPAQEEKHVPDVTEEMILAWEKTHGVVFPTLLKQLYQQRNGGEVADADITLNALEEIQPVEDDLHDALSEGDEDLDVDLVFLFGELDTNEVLLLNYGPAGPTAEPRVGMYHWDWDNMKHVGRDVAAYFRKNLATDAEPAVDWGETEHLDEVLARERIEFSTQLGGTDVTEIVLGRREGKLYHYVHVLSDGAERLERTLLPEPLSAREAQIDSFRPSPTPTFQLHLEPRKPDRIENLEAVRTSKGRWKNKRSKGVPVWVGVESTDQARLVALREKLFGKEKAAKAQKRDDDQAGFLAKMESLPPDAARAAIMHLGMGIMKANTPPDYSQMDPEAAAVLRATEEKLKMLMGKVQAEMAKHPLDEETKRFIEQMKKHNS